MRVNSSAMQSYHTDSSGFSLVRNLRVIDRLDKCLPCSCWLLSLCVSKHGLVPDRFRPSYYTFTHSLFLCTMSIVWRNKRDAMFSYHIFLLSHCLLAYLMTHFKVKKEQQYAVMNSTVLLIYFVYTYTYTHTPRNLCAYISTGRTFIKWKWL